MNPPNPILKCRSQGRQIRHEYNSKIDGEEMEIGKSRFGIKMFI
jgi:hypothetical protein